MTMLDLIWIIGSIALELIQGLAIMVAVSAAILYGMAGLCRMLTVAATLTMGDQSNRFQAGDQG